MHTRRRKRAEAREALRKADEEYMEQRRLELLSDKDGYWHQRMRMEEQVCACSMCLCASVCVHVYVCVLLYLYQQRGLDAV